MKYSIETTENGCKETLSFKDKVLGEVNLVIEHERTSYGSRGKGTNFIEVMEKMGYSEEVQDRADECFNPFLPLNFMELAEEMGVRFETKA